MTVALLQGFSFDMAPLLSIWPFNLFVNFWRRAVRP